MRYEELEKNSIMYRETIDVKYTINKGGQGRLRFTKRGSRIIKEKRKIDVSKEFKMYIDRESLSLAFKQAEGGEFRFSGIGDGEYHIYWRYIAKEIKKNVNYIIQESEEYSFVLIPIAENVNGELAHSGEAARGDELVQHDAFSGEAAPSDQSALGGEVVECKVIGEVTEKAKVEEARKGKSIRVETNQAESKTEGSPEPEDQDKRGQDQGEHEGKAEEQKKVSKIKKRKVV